MKIMAVPFRPSLPLVLNNNVGAVTLVTAADIFYVNWQIKAAFSCKYYLPPPNFQSAQHARALWSSSEQPRG